MNRKEEKWRNEGAAYALRVAKEKGVEHLEQDLRRRGAVGIPMNIPEKAIEATYDMLAKRIMNTMKTVAMWVLYEEHGWRSVRLHRASRIPKHIRNVFNKLNLAAGKSGMEVTEIRDKETGKRYRR